MDNYYNLFKPTTKNVKHSSSNRSHGHRKSQGHEGGLFIILKIIFTLFVICLAGFLFLMIFSSNLSYSSATEENIKTYLTKLTENERVSGTENEIAMAKYINELMSDYGFESRLDGYEISPYDGQSFARNVVAIKKATVDIDNGDVLVLTAHYDSSNGTVGANDNAAGTAALIELANTIKGDKTDTTIVLAFLSATYENYRGANYLINNLSNLGIDKDKIIGVIDISKIGINTKSGLKVVTSDLKQTVVSEIMSSFIKKITKNETEITYEVEGVHKVFTSNNIPAVSLESKANSMYDGLSLDTMDKLSISNVKKVVDVLENTVREIMKQSTNSYLEMSKTNNVYDDDLFVMTKDTEIPFGCIKETVEEKMKFKGTFAGSDISENGDALDLYSYQMKWFNKENNITTKYVYTNSLLTQVNVELDNCLSLDEALKTIKKYLEVNAKMIEKDNSISYTFEDTAGRKLYTINVKENDRYDLIVTNFYTENTIYDTQDLYTATSNYKTGSEEKEDKLLGLISKVLMPRDIKRVSKYITYTDGLGYTKGYATVVDKFSDNSKFIFAMDLDDAFDNDNNYRNYKETLETIINSYAYILALNEKQVVLTESPSPDMIYLFDNGVYQETSYLKLYRDRFFKTVKKIVTTKVVKEVENDNEEVTTIDEQVPETLVKEIVTSQVDYTGEEIMQDFADSFVTFILESKANVASNNNTKALFFYDYEELVNIREFIRNNLGL